MNEGRRALRLTCQLAVALWIGLYLAWPSSEGLSEAVERIARVMPRPEPPEAQGSPATEEPSDPSGSDAVPRAVGKDELAEGARWLDGDGRFPALSCSYEDFDSFPAYARAMTALGARFVVVRHRSVVGALDIERGWLEASALDASFSPRARDYSGEPALARLSDEARERYGEGAEVMMLVPRELDAGLFGGIARALAEQGRAPDELQEIRGRYQRAPDGGIRLRVDGAVSRDGTPVSLDLLFDLGDIARAGAAA